MSPIVGASLVLASWAAFREMGQRREIASFAASLDPQIAPWADPIWRWASRRGLDPFTVAGIVRTESNGNPGAVGDQGASIGLMQVNTKVWGDLARQFNLRDPTENIRAGTYVLSIARQEAEDRGVTGTMVDFVALAAYNAGIGNAMAGYRKGDPEMYTTDANGAASGRYVATVLAHRNAYVARANGKDGAA